VLLPLPVLPLPVSCSAVLGRWYDVPEQAAVGFDLASLGSLLFHSVAISARKVDSETGHGWSLRVNPSSGNLHPTET